MPNISFNCRMFRQLYEGFFDIPAPAQQMNTYFNYTEPGAIRSSMPKPQAVSPAAQALMDYASRESTQRELQEATNMAINGQVGSPWMKGFAHRFRGFQTVPQSLLQMQEQCEKKSINDLVAGYDSANLYNCGIFYDAVTDALLTNNGVGRGYIGTTSNAVSGIEAMKPRPSGAWHPNPSVALRKANIAKCNTIMSCSELSTSPYRDICAWCATSGKAIPVDKDGNPLYNQLDADGRPLYPGARCDNTDRLFTASKPCPVDAALAGASARNNNLDASGQVCTDLSLSRDCIIAQARRAGCSDNGTLIQALNSGRNATNYLDTLQNNIAFNTYQSRAPTKLIPEMFDAGKATMEAVLNNLRTLENATKVTGVSDYGGAARNLCLNSAEEIDFCADEIAGNKASPFTLKCLQRQFRIRGGQGEGALYPTERNKSLYDSTFATWNDVDSYFIQLEQLTKSPNVTVQERALRDFLGIKRESIYKPSLPLYRNYEVYNFSSANIIGQALDGLFIGRNIRQASKGLPNFDASVLPAEQLSQLDVASQPSFVIITDLRPPREQNVQFAFTAKDGIVLTVNKDMTNYATELIRSEPDDFRNNQGRMMPIYLYNNKCTTLNSGGNNRIKVYWNSRIAGAQKTFKMYYTDCDRASDSRQAKEIDSDWISMTQEPNAPMLSFELTTMTGFGEKRLPEFFPVEQNGIVAEVRSSNFDSTNTDLSRINRPYINFTSTTSYLQVSKFIYGTSFNTISIVFNITQAIQRINAILTYSNMRLTYENNRIKLGLSDSTSSVSVPVQTGTWYIAVIRISGSGSFSRNKLMLDVVPLSDARNESKESTIFSGTQSFEIQRDSIINIINNDRINSSLLRLGANNENSTVTMSVASVRLYDQPMNELTIARDARNSFPRSWYNDN